MNPKVSKIALGTVQFGINYGISNLRGKVPESESLRILASCKGLGIDTLDTAAAYGDSESVLGSAFAKLGRHSAFRVISKFSASSQQSVDLEIKASLARLGLESLYGYLLHHVADLRDHPELWDQLSLAKTTGLVEKIGFSLYSPSELLELLDLGLKPDLIQIPFSVFDRRFETVFERCRNEEIEVHSRSAFLQGLVFLEPESLSPHFHNAAPVLRKLKVLSQKSEISIAHLCLGFCLLNPSLQRVVIGVESNTNLEENAIVESLLDRVELIMPDLDGLAISDESILLPTLWPK